MAFHSQAVLVRGCGYLVKKTKRSYASGLHVAFLWQPCTHIPYNSSSSRLNIVYIFIYLLVLYDKSDVLSCSCHIGIDE